MSIYDQYLEEDIIQMYESMKVNGPEGIQVENTENLKPTTDNDGNTTPDLEPWFITNISEQSFYGKWNLQKKDFDKKAKEMSEVVSAELNERLQNYLGFKPTIRNVVKDGFKIYMDSIGKLGGQNKIPKVANDRKIANQLKNLNLIE